MRCLPMIVKAKSEDRELLLSVGMILMSLRMAGVFLWWDGNDDLLREKGK